MVIFKELNIDPNSETLIVNVAIKTEYYFEDVFLSEIVIDTQDTFKNTGPSEHPIYNYSIVESENIKSHKLVLPKALLNNNLSDTMFFIWVKTKGTPHISTPCGQDNINTLGVIIDYKPIYSLSMYFIKSLGEHCKTPKGFMDYILRLKALQLSIKTGNYTEAIKLWNKFFRGKKKGLFIKHCKCNGGDIIPNVF